MNWCSASPDRSLSGLLRCADDPALPSDVRLLIFVCISLSLPVYPEENKTCFSFYNPVLLCYSQHPFKSTYIYPPKNRWLRWFISPSSDVSQRRACSFDHLSLMGRVPLFCQKSTTVIDAIARARNVLHPSLPLESLRPVLNPPPKLPAWLNAN